MFLSDAGSHADDDIADRAEGSFPGGPLAGDEGAGDEAGPAAEPFPGMQSEADSVAEEGFGGLGFQSAPGSVADDVFGAEESFFGMQSESAVLTGVALGPGLRRGALVCVGALVGLGVLFWGGLAVYYAYRVFFASAHANPDMPHLPDARPWIAFYLTGALWAVGVGLFGLVARWRPRLLLWSFGCLVTAFFWPVGMAASAIAVAWRRRDLAASRRIALALLAVLVAVAGPLWRFAAPATTAEQAVVGSDTVLLGTWHSRTGMSVVLRADGTYTAGALSGGGLGSGEGIPASAGMWDTESPGGRSGVRLQIDGDLSHSVWFDVYQAGSDLVLCASDDPSNPCEVVLRRS